MKAEFTAHFFFTAPPYRIMSPGTLCRPTSVAVGKLSSIDVGELGGIALLSVSVLSPQISLSSSSTSPCPAADRPIRLPGSDHLFLHSPPTQATEELPHYLLLKYLLKQYFGIRKCPLAAILTKIAQSKVYSSFNSSNSRKTLTFLKNLSTATQRLDFENTNGS
ncbi:hypothetical protein CFP56_043666 [Quercus suber]|uniref:Uncharacterized protein n=1 Tax=Quercus suber TaxID=58331 RepID=A0AAW0LHS1_QUESU